MTQCRHSEVHVVETSAWNGSKWEPHYHCGKCGKILKKERVMMANRQMKTQYIAHEKVEALPA